ncbi:MAG: hypothetical protein NXI10_08915 [bacterium]|nr:hypothetical protein [bacterium]
MKLLFFSFCLTLFPFESFSQDDFYTAKDTIHIEFRGRVSFIDSVHREVEVFMKREGELVAKTHIDTAGRYQLDGKILAQCYLTLHFRGEGLLEKYVSFDLTSDSINRFPVRFRPIQELDIDMTSLNTNHSITSIEVAKFDWYNEHQFIRLDAAHAREQKEFLKKYAEKEEED